MTFGMIVKGIWLACGAILGLCVFTALCIGIFRAIKAEILGEDEEE